MPVSVTGGVSVSVGVTDQRTSVTGALSETGLRQVAVSGAWTVAAGIGPGLADVCWSDVRTLTTNQSTGPAALVDLSAVQNDAFGGILTFSKVKAMVIVAGSANTTLITIGRTASATFPFLSAAANLASLSAGGWFGLCDPLVGITVGGDPAATFLVANSAGASATYAVAIVGTSA